MSRLRSGIAAQKDNKKMMSWDMLVHFIPAGPETEKRIPGARRYPGR
jgi:hypothetical protein